MFTSAADGSRRTGFYEHRADFGKVTSAPDRQDEGVGDKLRRHLRLRRPADDAPGEQVDDGRNVGPTFGGPDISEVGDPLLVRGRGLEGAVEDIARYYGSLAGSFGSLRQRGLPRSPF